MKKWGLDIVPHRERIQKSQPPLDDKFKDPADSLALVFVCAMWLTGFDAPSCSTVYLDKPMRNHTLMQTIARANRVYPGKSSGVIVDYANVFASLEKALSIYGTAGGSQTPVRDKDNLVDAPKVDFPTGAGPFSIAAADLNGDSKLDLAVANYHSDTVSVLIGNGDGTFANKVEGATLFPEVSPMDNKVGDKQLTAQEVADLLAQAKAISAKLEAHGVVLTTDDRKRLLRARRGAAEHIQRVVDLATKHHVSLPNVPLAGISNDVHLEQQALLRHPCAASGR